MSKMLAAVAAIGMMAATSASAAVITFNNDTAGAKANGFVSADSNAVAFSDSSGSNLIVDNFGSQTGNSKGLAVFNDDASRLVMTFTGLYTTLSLSFGNDDPGWTVPGNLAWLQLFNGATLVGTVSTVMNRNDVMDQVVSYAGAAFDRAEFFYGNAQGNPINLIEMVDNVTFGGPVGVSAPAAMALFGAGLLGLGLVRQRRAPAA